MEKIKTYVVLIDNKKFSKFQLSSNLVQVILAVRGGQRWVQVRDWLWTFRSGTFSIFHEKWITLLVDDKEWALFVHNSARHRTLLKMTQTHVNQVLPSETSTQEGGDKIPPFQNVDKLCVLFFCENHQKLHICKYTLCILLRILDFICNCAGKNSKTQMPWRVNKWVKSFQSSHVQKLICSNCWNIEIIPTQCDYRMQCLYQPQRRRNPQSRSTSWLRSQRLQKSRSGSWIVGLSNSLLVLCLLLK